MIVFVSVFILNKRVCYFIELLSLKVYYLIELFLYFVLQMYNKNLE